MLCKKYKKIYSGDLRLNKLHINWHLTDWCNYNCFYCIQDVNHHYSDKPKETQEDVEKTALLIRDKIKGENISFSILGGEVSFFDLSRINEILFKDNNCSGFINLTTNLSAPLYNYLKFLYVEDENLKFGISASYQWRDVDKFILKSNILKTICDNFVVTCVVTDKHNLDMLKFTYEKFDKENIPFKFVHGRVPKTNNCLYKLSDEVLQFINFVNSKIEKKSITVEYTSDEIKVFKSRGDVLKEISTYQNSPFANFKNMTCFTGVVVSPEEKVYNGSCIDREKDFRGMLKDVSLKPYKNKCNTDKGCSLCNSYFIWNGEY